MPFKRSIDNHTNSFWGLTRSVGEDGGFNEISNKPYHIYTNILEKFQKPNAIHSIIASYGRATAAPVARIILLCTCCHCMGFVVLHSQDLSGSCSSPFISLKQGLGSPQVFFLRAKVHDYSDIIHSEIYRIPVIQRKYRVATYKK